LPTDPFSIPWFYAQQTISQHYSQKRNFRFKRKYIPGTLIPILDASKLYEDQPEYALLLSWHIADKLSPKIAQLGYKGNFIAHPLSPLKTQKLS
jgi:hypothetical protein